MSLPFGAAPRGYAHPGYVESFSSLGEAWGLPSCHGALLLRPVGDGRARDAVGSYPMFSCGRPDALLDDLRSLVSDSGQNLVTVSLVADPLQAFDMKELDLFFPIKRALGDHYAVELEHWKTALAKHHRRKIRKATTAGVEIRIEAEPVSFISHWNRLYGHLAETLNIQGLRRFSDEIFASMIQVPGVTLVVAWLGHEPIGADWYFADEDRVYAHLSAYSPEGYERSISYPMMAFALEYFQDRARILDLGGVPRAADGGEGLAYFKAGWATRQVPAFFWGKVVDPDRYRSLCGGESDSLFFPAYRASEF